jgi:hypothetical protein
VPRQGRSGRSGRGRQRDIPTGPRTPQLVGNRLESPTIRWDSPPEQVNLPSVAEIVNLDVAQRYKVLQQFGLQMSWDEARAEAAGYVARMSNITDRKTFDAEVDKLVSVHTKRGLLGNLRNAYRQFTILDVMDGLDPRTAEFTRIVEGDEASCDSCLALAAEEGTMAYHTSIGLPGSASCEGGANCRCDLVNVI